MRQSFLRTIGMLVLAGLVMPVGMLFATETHRPFAISASHANWADTEAATNLLNQMQTLAVKARKNAAVLQVQDIYLNWQAQSQQLARARKDVNKMSADLVRLDHMKQRLEPWQQSLVRKVTPKVHEMVYQLEAAIKELDKHENKNALALSEYPQNINMIYQQSNQMVHNIRTVTQYVHAKERLAALERSTSQANS